MDTIKVNHGQTKMIAHRGLSFLERENTNAAFIAAGNRSYYGIETDVRKTADGQFVLLHARSTGEYTHDTVDIAIATNDYAAIKNLVLDDLDGSSDRQDLKVPLLVEYIKICKKYDKKCVLEIKDFFSREDIIKVIDIIKEEDYLDGVIFIAFEVENLIMIRELLPEQPIQWLTCGCDERIKEILYKYHFDLDMLCPFQPPEIEKFFHENGVKIPVLTKELIDELHANGVKVNCWTCDIKEDAEKLAEMGVDFITTDILE